jgi:orotate phosphoribosyltransferase
MTYKSISTLNKDVSNWTKDLPRDFDLIVGIPRSGLLVANLLALHLDLPLTDVEGLIEGRITKAGRRDFSISLDKRPLKILVVDDSINSSGQMRAVKTQIMGAALAHHIYYSAVYSSAAGVHNVDYYYEILPTPRVFEWNLLRHNILLTSCLDIDGVLCADPDETCNDDATNYENFLKNARPLFIPKVPVGWLVTCRLEKYRKLTEDWLKSYSIEYRELIMMNYPDQDSRMLANSHSRYKATAYKSTGADLFIESSLSQAVDIAFLAQKTVYCVETKEMVEPLLRVDLDTKIVGKEYVLATMQPSGTGPYIASMDSNYTTSMQQAIREILSVVPPGETFILIDHNTWGVSEVFANRKVFPFLEKDGYFWGVPPDDDTAIIELNRMIENGASFLAITWPAFWWLEHYKRWNRYLLDTFSCLLENDRLIMFQLRDVKVLETEN